MSHKLPGKHMTPGYWGRSPQKHVDALQTGERIRVLQEDKLMTRPKRVGLWLPVGPDTPGVVPCTCVKDTTKAADRPCGTCYGTKYAPGYLKFHHITYFFASAEAANFTLTDCALETTVKPHRILLNTGATTGTIETQDKAFTNPEEAAWTVHMEAFERSVGATVAAEFSTDAGVTWFDVADINGDDQPVASGSIRFRVTLTRSSAADKSPAFEILRLRRPKVEALNRRVARTVTNYQAGEVLISRTWVREQVVHDAQRGVVGEHLGDRGWTSPLDLFDTTLTRDTPPCRIDDLGSGPHPFYEYVDGVLRGTRYPMTELAWNEQLGLFTHQTWADRRAQPGEVYWNVW